MAGSSDDPESRRWSVASRLEFATNRLYWDGTLGRDDLMGRFGLSPAQATADLSRLRADLGGGVVYDVSRRAYVSTEMFAEPPLDAARLLGELRLIAEGVEGGQAGTLASPPPMEIAGGVARSVDSPVLRHVLWAIRDQRAIEASYVSFQRPEVERRKLSPHALVYDGFRWHVRAHDSGDGRFKDFLPSRLSQTALAGPAAASADDDHDWREMVGLRVAPHPGLTEHQKAVVEQDYGMTSGVLDLEVRRAIVSYARRRLGLVEGHERRPPSEQQIVLVQLYSCPREN